MNNVAMETNIKGGKGMRRKVGDKLYFIERVDSFVYGRKFKLVEVVVDKANKTSYYCGYNRFQQRDDKPHNFTGHVIDTTEKYVAENAVNRANAELLRRKELVSFLESYNWYGMSLADLEQAKDFLTKESSLEEMK